MFATSALGLGRSAAAATRGSRVLAAAPALSHRHVSVHRLAPLYHTVSRPVACFAASEDAPAQPNNRLFVGNLSWDTSAEVLGKHFAQAEGFVAANVAFDPRRNSSRGFGFVEYATPEAAERARQMLAETELDGRNLLVRISEPRAPNSDRERRPRREFGDQERRFDRDGRSDREGRFDRGDRGGRFGDREPREPREQREFAPGTRVWVSNLPFSAEWQDLKDVFRSVGEVEHVRVVMKRRDGRLLKTGSAVVAFADAATAERAVEEMNGYEMEGREIKVREYSEE